MSAHNILHLYSGWLKKMIFFEQTYTKIILTFYVDWFQKLM